MVSSRPAPGPTTVKGSKSNSDNKLKANRRNHRDAVVASETDGVPDTGGGDFMLTHICVSPAATGGILLSADGLSAIFISAAPRLRDLHQRASAAELGLTCSVRGCRRQLLLLISGLQAPAPGIDREAFADDRPRWIHRGRSWAAAR
jgi:hypothetical protein